MQRSKGTLDQQARVASAVRAASFLQEPLHSSRPRYRSDLNADQARIRSRPAALDRGAEFCGRFRTKDLMEMLDPDASAIRRLGRPRAIMEFLLNILEGSQAELSARRGRQPWRGRGLRADVPLYRNNHSGRRKVRKILQRTFSQDFLGQTAFRNSFSYRGAFCAGLLPRPAGRPGGPQAAAR
jgi:hypothetical protein